jgi:hypothetical protein
MKVEQRRETFLNPFCSYIIFKHALSHKLHFLFVSKQFALFYGQKTELEHHRKQIAAAAAAAAASRTDPKYIYFAVYVAPQ